ncbi:MAG TPA: TRAP transporter small permease [Candidatus Methylomirabilis sp.]|nr:TRAP transporter small permease [Candidatus Methylomirabilis sp.]
MRKVYDGFIVALQVYSGVLCLVMLGVVLVGIFYRYVVGEAISWYDEFAGFTLVWLTMYGSVVGLAKGKHISFETLVEKLPRVWQRATDVFGVLCVLSFSMVMVVSGWHLVREMSDETAVSIPAVKMAWIYSVMPISGALMGLVCVVQLIRLAMGGEGPEGARAKALEEAQ